MSHFKGRIGVVTRRFSQTDVKKILKKNHLEIQGRYINSTTPVKALCLKCNNVTYPRVDHVNSRGHQCGFCNGSKGAAAKAIEFAKKLGHEPLEPYRNALAPWKMKCGSCGNVISPRFNTLQQGRMGCKYCGHSRAGEESKRRNSKDALKIMRAAFLEPLESYPGSHIPWKSRCMKCDSLTQPRLSGIKSGQGGCRKCGVSSSAEKRKLSQREAILIARRKKLIPLEPYRGSGEKWKCKCLRCGKISSPFFNNIRDGVYGCGWCAKKLVDPLEARKRMKRAGLEPLVAYPGSDIGWLCRCIKCNREVSPAYGSIRGGQGGCKWCKVKNPWIDPNRAMELFKTNKLQPLEPFKNSHTKWKSRCLRCEKIVFPSYRSVNQGSGGCKYCAPNFVDEKRINEVMKRAGLVPLTKYVNSKEPWKVKHQKCGRTFFVEYANVRGGASCRYCAGVSVIPKEAIALFKQRGLTPLTPYPGGKKPWKCKCNVCKKVVYPQYSSVATRNSGCIYCAGGKVDPKDAVAFMKKNGLTPLGKFPGARKPWKCKCKNCNNIVSPQYSSMKSGQGGCRFCADWGIDYEAEGILYLMTHPKFQAHKIGIGNLGRSKGTRVLEHKRSGWLLVQELTFSRTDDAFKLEQKVLDWLRKEKGLPPFLSELEMPQGGYTETVDASEIDLVTIWKKVKQFARLKA